MVTLYISGPLLLAGLIVGLLISVFQAATSVQESTLTYIPKLVAVFAVLLILLPWMMNLMLSYTTALLVDMPMFGRGGI
jgi:flagellar biosynthetic protein FliQ